MSISIVRCAVIGSPGSIKDEFYRYLIPEAQRLQLKVIIDNKSRLNLIKDTKAAKEVQGCKDFSDELSRDADRACYGLRSVEVANELMAVQTLLISDDLFRSGDVLTGIAAILHFPLPDLDDIELRMKPFFFLFFFWDW
ncbi:hypothetical protein HHK36_019262 [Tetracentron sinense]|uniref:eRF1 domain-containing protein n=1 Tax=Tetracentron sinense TaxID=13715 RepID=A0A834YTK0_TETSI|nr:hypothetical protein HHK36_019262 [Tetracentron sinense]